MTFSLPASWYDPPDDDCPDCDCPCTRAEWVADRETDPDYENDRRNDLADERDWWEW